MAFGHGGYRPGAGSGGRRVGAGRRPGSRVASRQYGQELGRLWAREILDDPEVRALMLARARQGELAPVVEQMLWAYAYGLPGEHRQVTTVDGGVLQADGEQ